MAERSIKTNLIFRIKGWPRTFSLLKGIWFFSKRIALEGFRACGFGYSFGGPRGFFTGLELLDSGICAGRVLLRGQELPKLPSSSLIKQTGHNQNGRQPWPVFWIKMKNARLVGDSLAPLNSYKQVMLEAVYGEEFAATDPSYHYSHLHSPLRLEGGWTSLISRWDSGYYHWFHDALPRLALLGEFPGEIKILIRGPLSPYQRESLEMLGLLERIREIEKNHLIIEDYYFSSPPGMTGCTNPYVVSWLREKFLPHQALIETPGRFFIKRQGKTRGIINQEEIAEYFLSQGWGVIDLETLGFAEQIAWFANAEIIVGEHGGGFSNLVWCRSGTKVLELCADNFLNGCYEGISLCLPLEHRFEVVKADYQNRFTLNPNQVMELIESY
jgi:hypothetical protein